MVFKFWLKSKSIFALKTNSRIFFKYLSTQTALRVIYLLHEIIFYEKLRKSKIEFNLGSNKFDFSEHLLCVVFGYYWLLDCNIAMQSIY